MSLIRSKSKPDEGDLARIAELEKEIAQSTNELSRLKDKAATVEMAIKDLEKKILDIGGAKLLSQRSKVDGIKLHINIALEEITKAEVHVSKAEKDAERCDKAIAGNIGALEEIEAELEELNGQLEECDKYVSQLQDKVDKAQTAAENAKEDLDSLKTKLDEKTEQIQKFRQKEVCYVFILVEISLLTDCIDGDQTAIGRCHEGSYGK